MTAIEPGTQVRVIVEGTVSQVHNDYGMWVSVSTGDALVDVPSTDPAVQVVPIDPDRPALDRETIARELLEQRYGPETARRAEAAKGGWYRSEWANALRDADATLVLIEAAHPGLIR